MLNEIDVLREVISRLDGAGWPYMLTGSLAMTLHALPRMTRDIDLVVELEPADAGRVVRAFEKDYYVPEDAVTHAIQRRSMFNLLHLESAIKVDVMVRKSGEYRQVEFARRWKGKVRDFEVWTVSKEDLILSKLSWAKESRSEVQLRDVRKLIASGCDTAYIDSWTDRLGVAELWKECQHE